LRYLPKSDAERLEMLAACGLRSAEELFAQVPAEARLQRPLNLAPGISEYEIVDYFKAQGERNGGIGGRYATFLGAGVYNHYRPVVVDTVVSRGEFLTSYTPYQSEISQGTLTTIFEFQTMICQLTGMDVANASMYDGATSMAEAAIMSTSIKKREKVAVSEAVHPHYRQVLETYCWSMGIEIVVLPAVSTGDTTDYGLADGVSSVIVQYPNFFGTIEDDRAAALRDVEDIGRRGSHDRSFRGSPAEGCRDAGLYVSSTNFGWKRSHHN